MPDRRGQWGKRAFDEAGFSLAELRIVTAIIFFIVIVASLAHWGFSPGALKGILVVPLALIAVSCALSLGSLVVIGVLSALARLRIGVLAKRMARGETGLDPIAARLAFTFGMEDAAKARVRELTACLETARVPAMRLLLRSRDSRELDLDSALITGAAEWPEDLMVEAFRHARSDAARLSLTGSFLSRAGAKTRTRILSDLFSSFASFALPAEPSDAWILVLARSAPDLDAIQAEFGIDRERIARYRRAIVSVRAALRG